MTHTSRRRSSSNAIDAANANLKVAAPHIGAIPPQNIELEEAILGALMLDKEAFIKVKSFMNANVFYQNEHIIIYTAIEKLNKDNAPIDILTVAQKVRTLCQKKKIEGFTTKAEISYFILQLTDKVASAANIEYHCRIIHALYMRREMIRLSREAIDKSFDLSIDPFTTIRDVIVGSSFSNPQAMIKYESMRDTMILGSKEKPSRHIIGNLFKENEVGILFGDEGCGKSVLAMQMAAAAASGIDPFKLQIEDGKISLEGLKNDCDPKSVIFYDFELERSEIYQRYRDEKAAESAEAMKEFEEHFFRAYMDPDFLDMSNTDEKIISEIESGIIKRKPELVFIDNLTFISKESSDPMIATNLMMKFKKIQQNTPGLTIIVIAHTPKRDSTMPMETKHIAGAKNIPNFAKTVVAVGKSRMDPNRRYLKHCKCRNGQKIHGFDNVIECVIGKNGVELEFEITGYGEERDHLAYLDTADQMEAIMSTVSDFRLDSTFSWRRAAALVVEKHDLKMAHTTLMRNFQKWETKNQGDDFLDGPSK